MDHESLRTASTYLNNLLLSRGLLRHGTPIDFVKPSKDSRAQIINLVHDLILRADRDQTQRETVAENLRALRADEHRHTHDVERIRGQAEDAERRAAAAQNAERAAQAEAKKTERAMKTLQEQTAKLKTTLAQVKASCANDVRKRDLELARLKTHLQGQQRGNRVGMAAPSMTLAKRTAASSTPLRPQREAAVAVADPEYSLKQETTDFLTQLSQSLSDENDALIAMVQNAVTTIRTLLNLDVLPASPASPHRSGGADSAIGSLDSEPDGNKNRPLPNNPQPWIDPPASSSSLPPSHHPLSTSLTSTLSSLTDLLTNPNYVSVEEVEAREEEIARLRAGWERMEGRWREVLAMMEGWRRRMDTGDRIGADEIRRGIGLVSPRSREVRGNPREGEEETEVSFGEGEVSEISIEGGEEGEEGDGSLLGRGGREEGAGKRKREALEPPDFFDLRPSKAVAKGASGIPVLASRGAVGGEGEEVPSMTVEEKLRAAQAEAEEAAAATDGDASARVSGGEDGAGDDTLGGMPSPMVKRTRIKGRPRRRKSTLSPEELDALLAMGAEG